MAADFELEFPEGTDFLWEFTLTDQDGVAIDISGATITLALFSPSAGTNPNGTAELTYTTANNVSITDGNNGVGTVDFEAEDTVNLQGSYIAELEVVTALSKTYSKWGKVKITPRRLDA